MGVDGLTPLVTLWRTSSARFLIIEAKLCFFPPLPGFEKILTPKLKRFVQALRLSGDWVIRISKQESAEQHAEREDLGMCLMIGTSTEGWLKEGVGGFG